MESNKQIDYDTLEWFDCKNNFPPISIDLYVDSEHGYGIGRLGKRVKDGSIIWTVHLDSGHVYLVYAFYKVKRWAYMPKDEKTNTKLKHELMLNKDRSWVPCYLKSEADKVIAYNKYKRCLAMADWCEATSLWCYQAANTLPAGFHATLHGKPVMIEPERLFKRSALLTKWNTRWFELSKKFKEAK